MQEDMHHKFAGVSNIDALITINSYHLNTRQPDSHDMVCSIQEAHHGNRKCEAST
jgi:hypothetical protein